MSEMLPADPAQTLANEYRGMDRDALTRAYDNSGAVADSAQWLKRWSQRSADLRANPGHTLNMAYGDRERQEIDYFACGKPNRPLFVFLHGGYWQRNHRDMFSFVAEGPMAQGFDVAVVGYTLAPEATLQEMVDECSAAIRFLVDGAPEPKLEFDRTRVVVGGWSAGGHLAATLVNGDLALRGALSISGIFDLEPIWRSALNDKLGLSFDDVRRLSPLYRIEKSQPTICAAYGTEELPELQRQSTDYAQAAKAVGARVSVESLKGRDHFSILEELCRPDGKLVSLLQILVD
jgi:arylformamidase